MVSGMARGQVASPRPFGIDTFLVLPHLIAELEKLQLRGTRGTGPSSSAGAPLLSVAESPARSTLCVSATTVGPRSPCSARPPRSKPSVSEAIALAVILIEEGSRLVWSAVRLPETAIRPLDRIPGAVPWSASSRPATVIAVPRAAAAPLPLADMSRRSNLDREGANQQAGTLADRSVK